MLRPLRRETVRSIINTSKRSISSIMIASTSFSSGLSRVGLEPQQQEKGAQGSSSVKLKKKRFLTLSRPASSSSSSSRKSSKDSEAIGELTSSLRPKPAQQTTASKFSSMPRPPKTPKAPPTSSKPPAPPTTGATPPKRKLPFSLTSKSSSPKSESSPKPPKPIKASNLSFSELKKQHQVLLQEVEGLKAKLSEESKEHETKLQETQGRLEESEITMTILKQDIERKDALLLDKDEQIRDLQAQLDRTAFDKERLLMVIESVQRDALTGEPIFNDNDMWQAARDENRTKVQHYTTLLDTMMNTLTNTSNQLEEQEHYIKTSSQLLPKT